MFTLRDIEEVHDRIEGDIKETPLMLLDDLSQITGANIFVKLENRQIGGSVKARGAFSKVSAATERESKDWVSLQRPAEIME